MTDWLTPEQRSRNMRSIKSRGNFTTEETFRKLLGEFQIIGWRRHLPLPGKPDFAFPKQKVAIFLDGCFWHGCPRCYRAPADNQSYWTEKHRRNQARDRRFRGELRARGWKVLRVWEHSLKSERTRAAVLARLRSALARRASR